MAVPGVTFTIAPAVTITPHSVDDVVFCAGVGGTGATGVVGTLYAGDTAADFDGPAGTGALDTPEFLAGLFANISPHVIYTPLPATPTPAQITAALNLAYNADPKPTVLHLIGDLTAPANAVTANAHVTTMAAIAAALNCRVVANAAQDTIANAIAWGGNNAGPRVIGVFNQSAAGNIMPAGPWLGAALAIAQEHGRAWGINLAPVLGQTGIRHALTPFSTADLTNLDNAGVSSIVQDRSVLKIIGDEFVPAVATDPQRFWSVGRVVDYVEEVLTNAARSFLSSTYSADRIAIHLTRQLNPIIAAGEILGGVVTPDLDQEQGTTKYLIAEIDVLFATNIVNIRLHLIV